MSAFRPECWRGVSLGVFPAIEHVRLLKGLTIDRVIDVGANKGQFSLAARMAHRKVPIIAFEPITSEATVFRNVHKNAPHVQLIESALGDREGKAVLHLSRSADSSSLLPITQQSEYFAKTEEVGTLEVAVQTLDNLSREWPSVTSQFLKIDVQGFELNVLEGAKKFLDECNYVYIECSEIELYAGQALRGEVESFLNSCGFNRIARLNELYHYKTMVQADYLFANSKRIKS